MKSYSTLRTSYGIDTKNTSTANLSRGDEVMNDFHRKLISKVDWPFVHRLRTATTVASVTFVTMPYDVDLVESVFVTVGSTRHIPRPAPSRDFWDELHYSQSNSDTPEYWFSYNGEIGLWPQPSSSANTISINAKIRAVDLNIADYGITISTLTNGSQSMVISTGTLTTPMAGMWVRPLHSITTDTSGDGVWYEISSVTSATQATLVRK